MSGARPAAAVLVEALEAYGVEAVFGNPGTTELPVLDAIGDASLEYVLGHHEDVAVGMAAGYATVLRDRYGQLWQDDLRGNAADDLRDVAADDLRERAESEQQNSVGRSAYETTAPLPLGVVNLHLTGGVAHGLGNLYSAWMAGVPLLVTAGAHSLSFRHEEPILAGNSRRHVDPYTKYAAEVTDPDALPSMLRRAVQTALTPPTGPTFLELPMDVAEATTSGDPERLGAIPTAGRGDPAALDRAAAALATAEDCVLLVGDGVARSGPDAVDAAVAFADAAGARVHGEALSAAVSFPRDHDLWASVLPPSGDAIRRRLDADAVVLAGCATNTTLVRHEAPLVDERTTLVHLGADASDLGKRLPADAAVIGDPGSLLSELAERLRDRVPAPTRRDRRRSAASRAADVRSAVASRGRVERSNGSEQSGTGGAEGPDRPSPAALVDALASVAPDALLVDEGISAKYALLARWDLTHGDFHSNKGGCLGYGLPAAVGVAIAEAERSDARPVVGFVGDGSYYYYPQAIRAAVRSGVDLLVVVPNNGGYASVAGHADERVEGGSDGVPGLAFEDGVDVAANAESHGATGHRVTDREALEDVLATASEREGVDVVDVHVRE